MTTWLFFFILFVIGQRLTELIIAKRNEKWMKSRGAIEVGRDHYKWFIILHVFFFIVMIGEVLWWRREAFELNILLFSLFIMTQVLRVWCITTLGTFWNTKVIVLPGVALIKQGPYRFMKHPNYLIVGLEFFLIPLIVGAPFTAIIFPLLHLLLIRIRIPIENRALKGTVTT